MGLNREQETETIKIPQREFWVYFEDDLEGIHQKKDAHVSEQALLRKYGGLKYLDVDTNKVVVTSREEMHFNKEWISRGWCVWTMDSDGNNETIESATFIEMILLNMVSHLDGYGIMLVRKDKKEDKDSYQSDDKD
jgi:hypothetical protein